MTTASAAGEIRFYKGIGYVAVGSYSGAGVYYFSPAATNPTASIISSYAPVSGTIGKNFQEVIVGSDGMIYAANNTDHTVLRINPSIDAVTATITATQTGTTGLVAGIYDGNSGIFVANTGGSVDFIANTSMNATAVASTSSSSPIYPGRLFQLPNGNLVATGYDPSYTNHTYLVTLSGASASVTEIKAGTTSFGSLSIAYNSASGLVYVPNNIYDSSNQLYVFDASGNQQSYSPVSVMTPTDNIANVAFYQN